MSIHVAILKREYLRLILSGQKTVESRLMKARCPPFGMVKPGERLFFKVSGGPFMATALAEDVHDYADQTPEQIDELCERWNPAVCAPEDYWRGRRDRPYVTMIRLRQVETFDVGPAFAKQNMRAWYVLEDAASPLMDVLIEPGALKNHYVSLPKASASLRESELTLILPDERAVDTDFADGGPMLRWRGWRRYFAAFAMEPGDTVRFVALGSRRYRIFFLRRGIR
ncbi:MAG: ASCH domain-containing protein [Planctomycetota bacterium]